jgi:hypothetical protein
MNTTSSQISETATVFDTTTPSNLVCGSFMEGVIYEFAAPFASGTFVNDQGFDYCHLFDKLAHLASCEDMPNDKFIEGRNQVNLVHKLQILWIDGINEPYIVR